MSERQHFSLMLYTPYGLYNVPDKKPVAGEKN